MQTHFFSKKYFITNQWVILPKQFLKESFTGKKIFYW